MIKKVIIIGLAMLVSAGIFVTADYAGLFGIKKTPEYDLREIKIRIADIKDNSPIVHTRAKCFQKMNDNACTQKVSGKVGIVSIMVPVIKYVSRSLLFDKGEQYLPTRDPELQVMLIHTDYMTHTITLNIAEHLSKPNSIKSVALHPRG
ncbi:MAG: hypothetical protein GKR93_07810 [Gammaproteobacteria bacterium]|nr:hypothetical protein [Gammaproteobacteria bacterium]